MPPRAPSWAAPPPTSGAAAAAATEASPAGSGVEAAPRAPSTPSPRPTEAASPPPPDAALGTHADVDAHGARGPAVQPLPSESPPLPLASPAAASALAATADPHADLMASCSYPPLGGLDGAGSSFTLSPDTMPFHPGCSSGGCTKSRRWVDDDGEESDDDNPTTYFDAVHRPAKPGPPQLMPPRARPPGVADGCTTPSDVTPMPREVGPRLARFTEEVQLKRMSPLIASPPRQQMATTRQPLPKRSRWIAAQPLAHIPTSKRGEVLLMQRMDFAPPAASISSVSKRAYDDLFAGNLTSSKVEALDELFPVTNARTSRKLFSDDEAGSCGQEQRP
ncbi:uncharacterized protein [Miscanthus floridulus]|uniref:uncharacterized protein n=1 Tax=Miscanthus floridulus TaxID=154761 RepID=UPI0034599992